MIEHHRKVRHILPGEQVLILADRIIDKPVAKLCFAGGPVFMNDATGGRQETSPATLPGLIGEVGVFDVKRMIERIKSADRQKFSSIDSTGTASGPEHRYRFVILLFWCDRIMPEVEEASFETSPGFPRFLSALCWIGEKYLRRHGEYGWVAETFEQGPKEFGIDDHVIVEEHDDIGLSLDGAAIVADSETIVAVEGQNADFRKVIVDVLSTSVCAAIVDNQNLVTSASTFY